jgi:hypothetical protein
VLLAEPFEERVVLGRAVFHPNECDCLHESSLAVREA